MLPYLSFIFILILTITFIRLDKEESEQSKYNNFGILGRLMWSNQYAISCKNKKCKQTAKKRKMGEKVARIFSFTTTSAPFASNRRKKIRHIAFGRHKILYSFIQFHYVFSTRSGKSTLTHMENLFLFHICSNNAVTSQVSQGPKESLDLWFAIQSSPKLLP